MAAVVSRLWRAFFDAGAYREAAGGTTGACMAHLALAVALAWLPSLASMTSGIGEFARAAKQQFSGMPAVHIEDGQTRLDPPGRHEFVLDGEPFVVFDPELAVDEALAAERGIFLTERHLVIVSERRADSRVIELSQLGDRVIARADVERWLSSFERFGAAILYPFVVAFSFAWRLGVAAAFGFVGQAIARMLRSQIAYEPSFRIATLAGIPTLFVGALAEATSHASWWPAWLGIVCTLAYLTFGLSASRGRESASPGALTR